MDLTENTTIYTKLTRTEIREALVTARVALQQKADDCRNEISRETGPAGAEFWARRGDNADQAATALLRLQIDMDHS